MAAAPRSKPTTAASSSREMTVAERPDRGRAADVAAGDVNAVMAGRIDNELEIGNSTHAIRDGAGPLNDPVFDRWLRARSEGAKKP